MSARVKLRFISALILICGVVCFIVSVAVRNNSGTTNRLTVASGDLQLPLIPWEGGPAYWTQFPIAKADGWDNPDFFPIAIWYDGVSSNAEVQADKAYGVNIYIGENAKTNYQLFARNQVYILQDLSNTPSQAAAEPGIFLTDEPDGRTTSSNDLNTIQKLVAATPSNGRFKEINFSTTVLSSSQPKINAANFEAMVNTYSGPVSADKYYYTQPSCNDIRYIIEPVDSGHCRTASSYGATVRAMRTRVAAGGGSKPVWNFVEDLSGAPDPQHFYGYIQPNQLKGAVMDSIINEARGILYFNQSFAGACRGGNVLRQVETGQLPCAKPQITAMKQIDQVIQALAPVINTESYQYNFGPNLDTMLKSYQGSAYIFSMIDGAAGSNSGTRTFTLPPALADAKDVAVLNEGRAIPVVNGKFTDSFPNEYTYHIYKVPIVAEASISVPAPPTTPGSDALRQ